MRTIKFRAWYKPLSKMYYRVCFKIDQSNKQYWAALIGDDVHDPKNTLALERSATEIMQFTGLHDKNGKEIYEGDILAVMRCLDKHIGCMCEKKADPDFIAEVKFVKGCFVADGLENELSDYTIVGNIYQNPELLIKPTL